MEEFVNTNRRQWIRTALVGSAAIGLPQWLGANSEWSADKELVILHTNDWHSRIDPFPEDDPKFPGQGGAARRMALIERMRNERNPVLLVDAGDMVQGTPYFNYYQGKPEMELMNAMGYEAVTLGNHDFDNGVEGLKRMIAWAKFPFVNCNYGWGDTGLEKGVRPSVVIHKGRLKIGILGVGIDLQPLLPAENIKGIHYNDPIECANYEAKRLKVDWGCDLVLCLSHLGYRYDDTKVSDRVLASKSRNIDLILGGHTHTFLEKPELIANLDGNPVAVNQVGWAGLRLGRINTRFSSSNNTKILHTSHIEVF